MPGKHPPSGQRIRRRVESGRYTYRDIKTGKEKSRGQWLNSRRSAERQAMIRRATRALKEAPRKAKVRQKPRRRGPEDEFEPVVVEVNAITYQEE